MQPPDELEIECLQDGCGAPILFVPGSFSTPAAWRPLQKHYPQEHRMFAISLCGYGTTRETRNADDFSILHLTRLIESAADRISEPFHLVGHSFGGTVALAAAIESSLPLLSLSLFEANPLALLRECGRKDLYDSTREMSLEFEKAVRAGEPNAAGRIIDFWGGDGSFSALPDTVQDYCRSTTTSNVLDWRSDFAFEAPTEKYADFRSPVLIVRGSLANPAMIAITDTLAARLPNSHSKIVEGASHFLVTTHPEDCAAILSEHIEGSV